MSTLLLAFSLYMIYSYQKKIIRTQEKQISVLNKIVENDKKIIDIQASQILNLNEQIEYYSNKLKQSDQ